MNLIKKITALFKKSPAPQHKSSDHATWKNALDADGNLKRD